MESMNQNWLSQREGVQTKKISVVEYGFSRNNTIVTDLLILNKF